MSASGSLFARTECIQTVAFAARRREGVVVAPLGVTDNMSLLSVSIKSEQAQGVCQGGAPGPMNLGGPQTKRGKKTRAYIEQGKQNKMCAFVNM
jgi:hypothetical protein